MAREESEIRPPGHRPLQAGGHGGKATRTKKSSRIPGIYVGEEVNTSLGKKKKVCFNIGGKRVFRMVDPDWRAPGRPLKKG